MSEYQTEAREGIPNEIGDEPEAHRQGIFDERFAAVMNGFGEACERNGIQHAIAIAMHPEEDQPLIFIRGHIYDVSAITAAVLRNMKEQLLSGLDSDP